ncbi:MAG: universal stress protein, partial [Chloroflexi bacterium]
MQDFHRARARANLQYIMARLTGKSVDLLSYDEVGRKVKATKTAKRTLRDIPLDAIVGSVGRYNDFTRTFLPRKDSDEERWARVKVAMTSMEGVPPIEVYQVDQTYFVLDGNHRVSIARQLGATHIQAYVTEVHTKVPLEPGVQPDDLIVKAEYADFLERTHLDELRPEADLSVTVPGQYRTLEEHIAVHRYFMGLEQQREIPYQEAVVHWYDEVYMPVVEVIREQGMLWDFPDRTETDLYLWICDHRAELAEELGWEVEPQAAALDLVAQFSSRPQRVVARVGEKLIGAVMPDELEPGPPPGQWRRERLETRRSERMFADVLVALSGEQPGWCALEHALFVGQHEEARVHGLHVVPSTAQKESEEVQAIQAEFERRCQAAGVSGDLTVAVGKVPSNVCWYSRWTDLVVLSLSYPPAPQPMARLGSGLSSIIRRCPRPVLAVPCVPPRLHRALLAYDGSPKAEEALFVATYLSVRWEIPLVVVTVMEKERERTASQALARAQKYLEERGGRAAFIEKNGPVAAAIVETAEQHDSDLIVMGGYG